MDLTQKQIAYKIKPITEEICFQDYQALEKLGQDLINGKENVVTDRCRVGNTAVDYFTFEERLRTRSKYNIHFYDFVREIETFKKKKFINTMLKYYKEVKNKNNTKNEFVVLKEVFNICIGAINIFRPLVAMEIYNLYKPNCILDICAGWGGRCIGACALKIPHYIGIDINSNLKDGYDKMKDFFKDKSETKISMIFEDSLQINYKSLPKYDMVFTSPPYYALEKYSHNVNYQTKTKMNEEFYTPLFKKAYENLQPNGHFILNVNVEIYHTACVPLFGEANSIMPLRKSKRQNNYGEFIYVWKKAT